MDSYILEPSSEVSVASPAVLERRIMEARADELEYIAAVDASSRLLRNAVSELRSHRADKGQQVKDQKDANWALLSDVLLQVELLYRESD